MRRIDKALEGAGVVAVIATVAMLATAAYADVVLKDEGTTVGPIGTINCSGSGVTCARSGSVGTITVSSSGGGAVATVVTSTADTSTSASSYTDIADLSWSVVANRAYRFQCFLAFESSSTGTGIGFSVNGPASPDLVAFETGSYIGTINLTTAQSGSGTQQGAGNTYDVGGASSGVGTSGAVYPGYIHGVVKVGATAGTLAIRVRSEVAASQVTVKAGSWCVYY